MECSVADGSHAFHDHTNLCLLIALWQTVLMSIHDHTILCLLIECSEADVPLEVHDHIILCLLIEC